MADHSWSDKSIERAIMIGKVVRTSIFPPWRIKAFDGQLKAAMSLIIICAFLVFISRGFTPHANPFMSASGLILNLTLAALPIGLAVIINLLAPRLRPEVSLGKWMAFLSASFFYMLLMYLALLVLVPMLFDMDGSILDVIKLIFRVSLPATFLILAFVFSTISIGFLYVRRKIWFQKPAQDKPVILFSCFIACVLFIGFLGYFSMYFDWS